MRDLKNCSLLVALLCLIIRLLNFIRSKHMQQGVVSIELSIILWLQVIIQNYWELRPLPNTATQTLQPRYPTLFDVPSKIIPQCSLCLQVTTDKIWSRYLHIQKRSEPFPHSDQRCLYSAIGHVDQLTKIALNFGFKKLLTFSLNIIFKQCIYIFYNCYFFLCFNCLFHRILVNQQEISRKN